MIKIVTLTGKLVWVQPLYILSVEVIDRGPDKGRTEIRTRAFPGPLGGSSNQWRTMEPMEGVVARINSALGFTTGNPDHAS